MSDYAPLKFFVPEPTGRPGDQPNFTDIEIDAAGSVRRPDIDVDPSEIKDLARSMVRVMNTDGEAVGPWAEDIPEEF